MSDGADTPEKNNIGQEPVGLQHKTVQVSGLNVAQRQTELAKIRTKMEPNGWTLDNYHDEGWSKSKATFTRPLSAAMNEKPKKLKPWHYVIIALALIFIGSLVMGGDTAGKELLSQDLAAYTKASKDVRQDAIKEYSKVNGISDAMAGDLYDFMSERAYFKDPTLKVSEVLEWAKIEMSFHKGKLSRKYYNLDNVDGQFSPFDGSHMKLVEYVKGHMKDPDTFKHGETKYRIVPYGGGEAPYVHMTMTFTGTNTFGGRVKNVVSAKADINDGNVYDVGSVEE